MAEAAVNLAFLGATSYLVARDVYSWLPSLPSLPKTSGKRFRGEPTVTHEMDDTCDPAALPPRTSRGPPLPPPLRGAVKACCESLLESKYVESTASGIVPVFSSSPRVTCLNDLGQGTTASTRVGNKIINKYLQIEGFCYLPANADSDTYRIIVVIDHECYGSICQWGQYVQGTVSSAVYSLPSMETVGKGKRFTTLVDRLVPINNEVGTANGVNRYQTFSLKVPLNFSTQYSGNAGTINDIVKNSLCCIEATGNGRIGAEWIARVVYLDG